MSLEDFINANKDKALSLNLKDDKVLQKQQIRPDIEFIQKAIDELENNLINCLVNNNHVTNKSKPPNYLCDIRLLLEYRKLQRSIPTKDWFDFTELVRQSKTEKQRIERMGFELVKQSGKKPYNPSKCLSNSFIGDIVIYNPQIAEYLVNNKDAIEQFAEAHKKGLKHFKKTYWVKLPSQNQIQILSEKYNNDWKNFITGWNGVWNEDVIKNTGFNNGILAGYANFERAYQDEFENAISESSKPWQFDGGDPQKSIKGDEKHGSIQLPKGFEKFTIKDGDKPLILKIYDLYKDIKGKDMAILIYVLHKEGILIYKKRANNSRKALMQCFNPKIEDDSKERRYFNTAEDNALYTRDSAPGTSYVYPDEVMKVEKKIKELKVL